jgi:hypothetical protein
MKRFGFGLFLLAVLGAVAFAGYQRLYSSFAPYDDEGYIMLSLFHFLDGEPLYDETYSQYGPAYYFVQAVAYAVTDLPITHDVTRAKTLVFWLLTAGFAAALIWRVTRSRALCLAAGLLAFFHLERFAMEPGHPQELCMLLIAAALFVATFVRGERSFSWIAVLLGFLAGTVCMTKLNVGVFMAVGLLLAFAFSAPRLRTNRWLVCAASTFVVALPVLLMRGELFLMGGIALACVVNCSMLAVMVTASRVDALSALECRGFFVGGALAVVGWSIAALVHGTSAGGLLDGLVLQHAGFAATFFTASPIGWFAIPWAMIGLWMACAASRGNPTAGLIAQGALVSIGVIVAGLHLLESFTPLIHGMQDRGGAILLIECATPLVWVILWRVPSCRADQWFARLAICTVAVLQPLGIFPTPGTQTAIGSLAILLAALVAVADLAQARIAIPATRTPRLSVATSLIALALATLLVRDVQLWCYRQRLMPLALSGAERLRLPEAEVARHRWLTKTLQANADSFLFRYNGMNSYYFWTQSPPPTALNATCWPVLFDDEQQQRIVSAIRDNPRLCVVSERQDWPALDNRPLVAFLDEHFEPSAKRENIEVWIRRNSAGPR